jgi:hypothetical protein
MKSKEYWNTPEDAKRYIIYAFIGLIFYYIISYSIYLQYPEDLEWVIIMILIGIYLLIKDINTYKRKITRPAIRLLDDFIILDHDKNVIPLIACEKIVINQKGKKMKIILKKDQYSPSFFFWESYILEKLKWLEKWQDFLENLQSTCQEHSIELNIN